MRIVASARVVPDLKLQPRDSFELMDIGRDHGEPVGDAGGRQPEVVRTDQGAGSPENGPHLCVRARRGEIDLQEGEALQNAFDANAERLARCRVFRLLKPGSSRTISTRDAKNSAGWKQATRGGPDRCQHPDRGRARAPPARAARGAAAGRRVIPFRHHRE